MDAPDPTKSGMNSKPYDHRNENLNLNRDISSSSLLNRDGSQARLVEDKHLGPKALKSKVGTAAPYSQWQQPVVSQPVKSINKAGVPRPPSSMKPSFTAGTSNHRVDTNYEEDYDEGGFEDADEIERLQKATQKENAKAQQFQINKGFEQRVEPKSEAKSNIFQTKEKNMEGFTK